ncbi:hypothetical protein KAFR_0A01460 [Kazachstania africana CBS 2517]|uniref:GPI-anchored wall transfer protein n=1 Tax=Kazachstania africana (strain ATCC 22294 / BCRC 22015 / CBS 2517 / CECT 1963 / NBRC 1671 / NRRL Y-8276) TaxID=1071382 RepID=H2AMI4_KAZAF|nr:hypothetical protein KAFR_0A01460 [Kazachstania africana CBS 2517]CCF55584.1 hypothetical protein KAFR_0A01460 [Kazachstania africana CBS 2517]
MSSLKGRKEEFVTGLVGGSIGEINLVTSVAVTSYFCWNLIHSADKSNDGFHPILDFALNWLTPLLSMTLYANDIPKLTTLMLLPTLSYWLYYIFDKYKTVKKSKSRSNSNNNSQQFKLVRKPYITAYRSGMLILTCLGILAVDFQIFPRRFAKVETWGTSLMDLGVGSFVFSNGLVSSRTLLRQKSNKTSFWKRIGSALRSSTTLLCLGLLRLYFVKKLDYQEHVTEYGVHWNFFITLALLPIVLVLIDPIAEIIPRFIIALVISFIYEWYLIKDENFLKFLILAERKDWISSNREGIVSFMGYCAIFLWGQSTGFYLLGNIPTKNNLYTNSVTVLIPKKNKKVSTWDKLTTVTPLKGLLIWFLILVVFAQTIFTFHPHNISRRFANLPYTIWVVAYNVGFLTVYCAVHRLFDKACDEDPSKLPDQLEAMNCNGLFLFLLANISTGLINMSMATIDATDSVAIITLISYAAFLAFVSTFLYKKKIFIRL